ncbi:pre-rrna processing protein utp22 [Moniliophthora roreri MCA 2997]|uniref:U3 small nucleolar RNA-associated protein 22 n=1 Tax=Moniliophthora roreri (strain MCA 2997) TaxID=1381753 RepID=V2XZV7_MONRO|nr:pre-rrna processing protein utp22 [Moniliophthora roreri MCA 2997]
MEENQSEVEEEEWGGITESQGDGGSNAQSDNKPYKPSGEEVRVIKDAAELFKSNAFKLQIEALLPNVRPKAKRIPPLERFLLTLHTFLSNLPSITPRHPLHAARYLLKKGISVPYSIPLPSEETQWKVAFEKPSEITLVGSWANKTHVKGQDGRKYGVDLAVEMPSALFQEKDYMNGRFFHKRAFYLAALAAAISESKNGLGVTTTYMSMGDDPRLTKLVIEPRADGSPNDFTKLNAQVCIIPVLSSQSPIPLHRLSPSHFNFRGVFEGSNSEDEHKLSSPLYNTAILTTLTPRSHLLSMHVLQQNVPAFNDAVSLLRVWANQHGYGEGTRMCVRGFDGKGPWWTSLLALLISGEESSSPGKGKSSKRKPLGRGLSSYQLFKAALDFLSKHDFENDPIYIKTKDGHRYLPDEYQSHHEAVFVDPTSTFNLLANVPIGSLKLLQHDAKRTLELLNSEALTDPFPQVFLKDQRDLQMRFDAVIHVDLSSVKPRKPLVHAALDAGSAANGTLSSMLSLVSQGLGDRLKAIAMLHASPTPRPLSQALPSSPHMVHIGLLYNTQHAFRQVDHGPPATETDMTVVERFREFWGDKAELRRFKDGSIVESVVWEVHTVDEKAHIPVRIVRHILQRHFSLEDDAVFSWQTPFDELLRLPEHISRYYTGSGLALGFKGALSAFDNLVKSIKALEDELPLTLSNVSATSESLRYTNVFSPVPLPSSIASALPPNVRYLHPIEIIFEFEKSSRWPDDLRAIQKIKLAFFERIARTILSSNSGLKASVVIGDGISTSEIQDVSFLEIITPDGWAFHARIWHDREATLLDRIIKGTGNLPHVTVKNKDHKKGKEYHEAVQAREIYARRFIHAPRHHRAITKLCHHFLAYSGTVRLVKRWFASHWLLHGHVSEEVIELICAQFFVFKGWDREVDKEDVRFDRASIPGSKERGFAAVIQFLKDWKLEDGLFVPLYDESSSLDSGKLESSSVISGVWRVSTKVDEKGVMWTARGPDVIVARRVQALAQATWKCLQESEDSGRLAVKSMFTHPTDDYNIILSLDRQRLPRYHQNINVDEQKLSKQGKNQNTEGVIVRPGLDPAASLFRDLQRIYADTFRVFHDPFGGDTIGVVWDSTLKNPRPFRVLGGFSSIPSSVISKDGSKSSTKKEKDQVVLNEEGIVGELQRIGSGIISGIAIHV